MIGGAHALPAHALWHGRRVYSVPTSGAKHCAILLRGVNLGVNLPKVLEEGRRLRVVLGEESSGRCPAAKTFFQNRKVDAIPVKKLHARLRLISRRGYPATNPHAYKLFDGDIHYIKVHGWRAYCLERKASDGVTELVVCLVVEKRRNSSLSDGLKTKARHIFTQHCERFP